MQRKSGIKRVEEEEEEEEEEEPIRRKKLGNVGGRATEDSKKKETMGEKQERNTSRGEERNTSRGEEKNTSRGGEERNTSGTNVTTYSKNSDKLLDTRLIKPQKRLQDRMDDNVKPSGKKSEVQSDLKKQLRRETDKNQEDQYSRGLKDTAGKDEKPSRVVGVKETTGRGAVVQNPCRGPQCGKACQPSSVYCSSECIRQHSLQSLRLLGRTQTIVSGIV